MQVIPVINVDSLAEARKRAAAAVEFTDLIHLDIADGQFTPQVSWGTPEDLSKISKLRYEVHLMVSSPEAVIDAWLRTGLVKRVIVHLEAMTDPVYILEKCKKYGAEAMLAINPGTEVERLLAHKDDFNYFQILAVYPGPAGQQLKPEVIEKIKFLKKHIPDAKIEVDGGITLETAKKVKDAGADIVVSGSYIFGSKNPRSAFEELSKI